MDLIPEDLRRAHEDGEVVFFCGAGVSMPAGLQSFKGLVEAVLTDLMPTRDLCKPGSTEALSWKAFDGDRYDEALDILESPREGGYESKAVRERVHYHLTKRKTKSLEKHYILTQLADLDTDNGRLVTTNFDHLFERACRKLRRSEQSSHKLAVHIAPVLPPAKPETSHGLTYLHGKLGHSSDDRGLVLTTADFGTAYLLEGWARRFVIELFRHYHIVFIGYRVEDPTMRYLVSALAAAREATKHFKDAYAFASYAKDNDGQHTKAEIEQEWRLKGLTPLAYDAADEHHQLWRELKNWADDHRQGIAGRRQSVAKLGRFPPVDEDVPAIPEIIWALKDVAVAKHFGNLKGDDHLDPGWIAPLQKSGMLSQPVGQTENDRPIHVPLVSHTLPDLLRLHEATFHLGRWIASCLDSREALDMVLEEGGVLHRDFRWQVQHELKNPGDSIPHGLRKLWQILADDDYAHALSAKHLHTFPSYPRLSPHSTGAIRVFLQRLRPIPVFKVKHPFVGERSDSEPERPSRWCDIEIALVGIEGDYEIDGFRKRALDWEGALAAMADDLTTRLKEALDWLEELELASPDEDSTHIEYRSISPHEQNVHARTWTQLIALARDSYDALVTVGDKVAAARVARRWESLRFPVFRRLALYASTGGRDA